MIKELSIRQLVGSSFAVRIKIKIYFITIKYMLNIKFIIVSYAKK